MHNFISYKFSLFVKKVSVIISVDTELSKKNRNSRLNRGSRDLKRKNVTPLIMYILSDLY